MWLDVSACSKVIDGRAAVESRAAAPERMCSGSRADRPFVVPDSDEDYDDDEPVDDDDDVYDY